jgi:hypothetical protein
MYVVVCTMYVHVVLRMILYMYAKSAYHIISIYDMLNHMIHDMFQAANIVFPGFVLLFCFLNCAFLRFHAHIAP